MWRIILSASLAMALLPCCGFLRAEEAPPSKPTREAVIALLEKYHQNPPPEPEKPWYPRPGREVIDLAKAFGTDFTGLDLSGVNFVPEGYDTSAKGVDFSGCDLRKARFYDAELIGCNFTGADLSEAFFYCANLNRAIFDGAIMYQTEMQYARLQGARFSRLDVSSCTLAKMDFQGADLSGTNFSGTNTGDEGGIHFGQANLTGASFAGTRLRFSYFAGADLTGVNFAGADLYWTNFTDANLEDADFSGANVEMADFRKVRGISAETEKSLKSRAGRWFYDLKHAIWDFLSRYYVPAYLLLGGGLAILTVVSVLQAGNSRMFYVALAINLFAVFSTASSLAMMYSGGHAVRQLSMGNMGVWRLWMSLWPCLFLGMLIANLISYVLMLLFLTRIFKGRKPTGALRLGAYLLLTVCHMLIATNWLTMFVPDA